MLMVMVLGYNCETMQHGWGLLELMKEVTWKCARCSNRMSSMEKGEQFTGNGNVSMGCVEPDGVHQSETLADGKIRRS